MNRDLVSDSNSMQKYYALKVALEEHPSSEAAHQIWTECEILRADNKLECNFLSKDKHIFAKIHN